MTRRPLYWTMCVPVEGRNSNSVVVRPLASFFTTV
jgi:hypothetical protein